MDVEAAERLRSEGDQLALAQLAQCSNVHLVASVDHVAASLMWSKAMEAMFRWQWVEAHTYAPYIAETLDKPSVLVGAFQQARQRGAGAVLRSLVPNARDVFALLVDHQLDDPESEGLDFKLLFRRATDGGGEVMYVPMDSAGLQQVQAELESIKAGQDDA
ncbi:origin recognition complex subunit 2 [Haematococcus lacustris]|uniref:Origin recognition complex subunit 2 n=1 Tax=Haematococcus lacustris TaxID=44745 RepID=A0A699Z5M1_HAELA|nr:origin recognition complex subunit 2 [Haematococcus lacustris]